MKIKTVWAVYFSATGTTKKVVTGIAKTIADLLSVEYKTYSFNLPEARVNTLEFSQDDAVVFGVPVYAGRVPNLLMPYIREKVIGNGALGIPVTLYGNRNFDDALMELRNVMQENGFHTITAGAFVGEHAFSTTLGAGRPDEEDMDRVETLARETAVKISKMSCAPIEPIQVAGNDPVKPYFTPLDKDGNPIKMLKVKPKTNELLCTDCKLCANICTMGAINPDKVSEVPGKCMRCCACIKSCPTHAKYFNDENFLYHQHDLERTYQKRASVYLFY